MELIQVDFMDKNGRKFALMHPFQNDLGEIVILAIDILSCNMTKVEVATAIEREMANRGYALEYSNRETWTDCEGYAIFKPQEGGE